jgi:hypothetical protein
MAANSYVLYVGWAASRALLLIILEAAEDGSPLHSKKTEQVAVAE